MHHKLQNAIIYCNGLCGILVNLFLIFVICTDRKSPGKGYRTMLVIVSVYNIVFSIVHMVVEMRYIIDSYGFVAFSEGLAFFGEYVSLCGIMTYAYSFTQSVGLLVVHCLYRFVNVTGKCEWLFKKWYCILSIGLCSATFSFLYSMTCYLFFERTVERNEVTREEMKSNYNLSIDETAYVATIFHWPNEEGVNQWRFKPITGSVICMSLIGIFYGAVCCVGFKLYRFVQAASFSESMRSLQLQLLRILLAQAAAPFIFEIAPVAIIFFGGVLGVVPTRYSMALPIFISAYAVADALLVLFLFKAYRERCVYIASHICCGFRVKLLAIRGIPKITSGMKNNVSTVVSASQW